MKRYQIIITLSDGNKVDAKSVGENQADALDRLKDNPQFLEFVGDSEIVNADIVPLGDAGPVNPEHYAVQYVESYDRYIVADKKNRVMVSFVKGEYNNSARITDLNSNEISDAGRMATILREIGEYISEYHKELI